MMMENFCSYCGILMNEGDIQSHCVSESHQLMIMSDEGREWKFRPPARGVPADQYSLCQMFLVTGKCRLSQQCCDAHGKDELDEWKERYAYRQMKLQHAKECRLQGSSYTEQLLEKWICTSTPHTIMKEKLDNVEMSIEPELNLIVSEKNCVREWVFRFSTQTPLHHIALLYEAHRSHFSLLQLICEESPGNFKEFSLGHNCQEWSLSDANEGRGQFYTLKVRFMTSIYGAFRQAIVFDFGYEPVLLQKLSVDAVSISDLEKLQHARETVVSFTERWSSEEVVIVPFKNRPYPLGEEEKNLMAYYSVPDPSKFALTQAVMEPALSKENYNNRLHELLCIEEMAQYELLSRYNIKANLHLTSCYLLTPNSAVTAKYAHDGEMFANMKLSSVLSEDAPSGRLTLKNCSIVLIASVKSKGQTPRKVYEALIEDKGKNAIYLRLSKQCTEELNLKPDKDFLAEVQFELNRLPLCEMHFSVDRLLPSSLVFPNLAVVPLLQWNPDNLAWIQQLDTRLNSKQREAILAITSPLHLKLPPVLIIGPFGTGKTFTLACAVKKLLEDKNARVLVCTHSNSAADIYIREYLHPLVAEGNVKATPLRVYYRHRWVATVHPTVLNYCLLSKPDVSRSFSMPTVEDVQKHRVVVTTLSTSRYLVQLGLEKGFFTHILIDEAAQAMECEAIMPLALANESTRIVLAGDHMQLSPEIYSQFAQERNLHTSLLERLYDYYPENYHCKILLCENYRSHDAIIRYTSELFYDNHLKSSTQQPRHEKYYPLTFFTARGEDIQDVNSTAYHNDAEVYEIVERVIELKKSWPAVWGDQDETSIGVVTPYYDQVVRIRAELRKKKLHGVSVERVLNVQGKQFRVIFLSAVRTRLTCNGPKSKTESDVDHGFLSNARLLNTAITRAQSLVAVVGDPVSLCSVGKCRKLWEKFILTCHKEDSLFGITWDSLRTHLDSMELKKNFILNPLAPEFVPGRLFHGPTANVPVSSGEMVCLPPGIPSQPWLFFPFSQSPFQGTPIMQPTLPPPMIQQQQQVPTPHMYNLGLNGVPQPVLGTPPHPFTQFPNPTLPQSNILPARMPTAVFPRRIGTPRLPIETQVKEVDKSCIVGRPIKGTFPASTSKPSLRTLEDSRIIANEDARRLMTRNDIQGGINAMPEQFDITFQNNLFANDQLQKVNNMKPDDMLKPCMSLDTNNFNGFPDTSAMNSSFKGGSNGTRFNFQKPGFENQASPINNVGFPRNNSEHMMNLRQAFNNQPHPSNDLTNTADRDRAIAAALDAVLTASNGVPVGNIPVDLWHLNAVENTSSRIEVYQALQEKVALLEKILPMGTDVKLFLETPLSSKTFFNSLLATEGPVVAKRFAGLMIGIKQDQEMLFRFQCQNGPMERREEVYNSFRRNLEVPISMRLQGSSMVSNRFLMQSQQSEVVNNFDPFKLDSLRSNLMDEGKNGYVRMPPNFSNILKLSREFQQDGMFMNRPVMEKPQEQQPFEFMNNSIGEKNDINTKHHPDLDVAFMERINEAAHRAEMERQLRESQKNLWPPLSMNDSKQLLQNQQMDGFQDSYLARLRQCNTAPTLPPVAPAQMFDTGHMQAKQHEPPVHMTAFSVSYPDIPNILPSHNSKDDSTMSCNNGTTPVKGDMSKVIQKPNSAQSMGNAFCSGLPQQSPYLLHVLSQPKSNTSPNNASYNQSPKEDGMTYAKILRSPHS